jgi:hypothetical protein
MLGALHKNPDYLCRTMILHKKLRGVCTSRNPLVILRRQGAHELVSVLLFAARQVSCFCCIKREHEAGGNSAPTLGFFKPTSIRRFQMKPCAADWTQEERMILSQHSLGFAKTPDRKFAVQGDLALG